MLIRMISSFKVGFLYQKAKFSTFENSGDAVCILWSFAIVGGPDGGVNGRLLRLSDLVGLYTRDSLPCMPGRMFFFFFFARKDIFKSQVACHQN